MDGKSKRALQTTGRFSTPSRSIKTARFILLAADLLLIGPTPTWLRATLAADAIPTGARRLLGTPQNEGVTCSGLTVGTIAQAAATFAV